MRCISCSIFRSEVEELKRRGEVDLDVVYFDSSFHMRPSRLRSELDDLIGWRAGSGDRTLLLCGECHAHMDVQTAPEQISRVAGINCCEILLGREAYRELRSQGAFFLLHEWAERWREIFDAALGLSPELAKPFWAESHRLLVYLDTEIAEVPVEHLAAVSEYTGLPWEVRQVSLDELLSAIRAAVKEPGNHAR